MTRFVGLDVSQKMTVICVVDDAGRRLWRGQCPTVPEQITVLVIQGVLAAAGIPATFITPSAWKRAVGLTLKLKDAARSEAIRCWPNHAALFGRVKDDGRAESALVGGPDRADFSRWKRRNGPGSFVVDNLVLLGRLDEARGLGGACTHPPRHSRCWRPSLVLAAVLAGPQSNRAGIRKTQDTSQKSRRAHRRWPLAAHRRSPRHLHSPRMRQLSPKRRICSI